jgi:hypothetical protein
MIRTYLLSAGGCTAFSAALAAECSTFASELATMRVADQPLREYLVENGQISQRLGNGLALIDRTNTLRMKALLKHCGWPVTSKYGKEASADAWLLIQHADQDRPFQRAALALLEQAVKGGEARGGDLAYLSDRLAASEGRPQLYGTQFKGAENCKMILAPIDSREAVNARRRAIPGMPTLRVAACALTWRACTEQEPTPRPKHSFLTSTGPLSKLTSQYTVRRRKVVDRASMTGQH